MPTGIWGPFHEDDREILVKMDQWFQIHLDIVRYPKTRKEWIVEADQCLYDWCEQRHIELLWHCWPDRIRSPSFDWVRSSRQRYDALHHMHLLVFKSPQDKMLFRLYFNNDALNPG